MHGCDLPLWSNPLKTFTMPGFVRSLTTPPPLAATMQEINPIRTRIQDMQQRSETLRGYL